MIIDPGGQDDLNTDGDSDVAITDDDNGYGDDNGDTVEDFCSPVTENIEDISGEW